MSGLTLRINNNKLKFILNIELNKININLLQKYGHVIGNEIYNQYKNEKENINTTYLLHNICQNLNIDIYEEPDIDKIEYYPNSNSWLAFIPPHISQFSKNLKICDIIGHVILDGNLTNNQLKHTFKEDPIEILITHFSHELLVPHNQLIQECKKINNNIHTHIESLIKLFDVQPYVIISQCKYFGLLK